MARVHPFLRSNRRAVAPVLAEILMVIIVVVMSATLWFTFNGIFSNATETNTVVGMKDNGLIAATAPDYCCLNDTLIEITFTSGGARAWQSGVQFLVESPVDSAVIVQGDLNEAPRDRDFYYIGIYHGSPNEASIANIGYNDFNSDGQISAGDRIELRGLSKEFHGATIVLVGGDNTLGSHILP